jgi:hypothetical protein
MESVLAELALKVTPLNSPLAKRRDKDRPHRNTGKPGRIIKSNVKREIHRT